MLNLKRNAFVATAMVALAASSALAGTKYTTNLVTSDQYNPPTNPTLGPKSKFTVSDKGIVSVQLAGVTDGMTGLLYTSSTLYNVSVKETGVGQLDGTEIIVIAKLTIAAIDGMPLNIDGVEVPIPVDVKDGKGKTKLNLSSTLNLLNLLGPTAGRGVEVTGVDVWGPLTPAKVMDCEAITQADPPATLTQDDPACRGGAKFGFAGLFIPIPD